MIEPITAIAASLAIGLAGMGAGYAEAHIGAAAAGGMTEKPEGFSKYLIYLVVPETIVVFGFIVSILLIFEV
jgi:V/A-type H+-transporting ATPase subunit K